jgi:hypothetical protein
MAIEGLLVYNIALDNARYQEEIAAFLTAFRKNGLRLTPVSNIKVFNVVEENPNRFGFAVFWDKDIHVARYLEDEAHIPIFNNQHAIGTCSDRALTYLALRNYNVPMPQTVILPYTFNVSLLNYYEDVREMLVDLPYPFLIKDRFESLEDRVYLIPDEAKFKEVLIEVGKKSLMAQQYILPQGRRVLRVSVVGAKSSPESNGSGKPTKKGPSSRKSAKSRSVALEKDRPSGRPRRRGRFRRRRFDRRPQETHLRVFGQDQRQPFGHRKSHRDVLQLVHRPLH